MAANACSLTANWPPVLPDLRGRRTAPTLPERRSSACSPSMTSTWPWERGSAPVTVAKAGCRCRGYSTRSCPVSTRWGRGLNCRWNPSPRCSADGRMRSWAELSAGCVDVGWVLDAWFCSTGQQEKLSLLLSHFSQLFVSSLWDFATSCARGCLQG